MAESADPSMNRPPSPEAEPALAAPVAALKLSTRRTRERMTANLNALEQKARSAVGGGSPGDVTVSAGQSRLLSTTSAVAAVRRLRAMPVKTAVAISVVTACVVAIRARRSRS